MTAMIYIVEDDENIRELVTYTLESLVMPTKGFENATDFEKELKKETPDLFILDLMLPDKDGLTLLKEIRANSLTANTPVLILSAKTSEVDKVHGLNLGADDYLAKPFGVMELVARVNALLRRASRSEPGTVREKNPSIEFANLRFDKTSHEFYLNEVRLNLTNKEYLLLEIFIENPQKALSRDHLLTAIWDYQYDGGTRTVDVHVASLRQKLGDFGNKLETIRGFGYRFQPESR
jgi:two-component system alkaline phosphatase synthesis response regulator PhoP